VIGRLPLRRFGLGLLAGAILHGTAPAQGATRRDTTAAKRDTSAAADTARGRDTTHVLAVAPPTDTAPPRDTIKAPLAQAPAPVLIGIGEQYHWDRDAMFATGAFNLLDLLSLVPGVTTFRSGWLSSPAEAAYLGNPARVRVFYDGVELDALASRSGGILDLDVVPLWTLEDVTVERGADEIRVYLRSWSVTRTTPSSRVDIASGDQNTNLYRGFYGKRFRHGEALQVGFQQFGTTSNDLLGGGDELSLLARLGWAHGPWSVDAFATRANRTRDPQTSFTGNRVIPGVRARRTDAYVRAAYGTQERGPWVQLMVAALALDERPHGSTDQASPDSADTAEVTRERTQYIASAGYTRGALRLSATSRTHTLGPTTLSTFTERASVVRGPWALALRAEQRTPDTTSTESAELRISPLSFLSLSGAVTRRHGGGLVASVDNGISMRAAVGLRLDRVWLTGGFLRRDAVEVPGLQVYDTSFVDMPSGVATGLFGAIRGPIYKDLGVDISGVRWSAPGFYRPQYQSRAEIYVRTNWLSRFPRNNFGFLGSLAYEYRSATLFPMVGTTERPVLGSVLTPASHVLIPRLEIRIIVSTIFIQQYLTIMPARVEYVPGFIQPRQRVMYGVRWHFWN
jgi:hypothetical protein